MSISNLDDRKGHVAGLIKLAKADGIVTESEAQLIRIIAIRMGLSSSEFNEIIINIEHINSIPPTSREEKEQYLYDIFQLMKVDLRTDEEEQQICEQLGLRLGFGVSEVKKAGIYMSERLTEVVSFNDFKAALNNQ